MEIGLTILLFVCMTALLYVLLSLKITRQVDLQMKEFYKTRIHSDIQEFYREMEGYAALMENRIQRFKSLVERGEQTGRAAALADEEEWQRSEPAALPPKKESPVSPAKKNRETPLPQKGKAALSKETPAMQKKAAAAAAPQAKKNEKSEPAKAAKPVVRAKLVERPVAVPQPVQPEPYAADDEDSAIAEELMKDLFAHDEMQLSKQLRPHGAPHAEKNAATAALRPVSAGNDTEAAAPQVANFFSRIGKAIEPMIFGEKKSAPVPAKAEIPAEKPVQPAAQAQAPKQQDFAEVLRRAEQIRAEKKAERERAEIEARAEFYTGADTFSPTNRAAQAAQPQRPTAAAEPAVAQQAFTAAPRPQARNSLAVKELDQHTVNFLIDSLVQDNGYRRQALRALTENNIPLEEIARLSRIDIGELQLMRQLGKF